MYIKSNFYFFLHIKMLFQESKPAKRATPEKYLPLRWTSEKVKLFKVAH